MVGCNYFREKKKHYTLRKTLIIDKTLKKDLNYSNLQEEFSLRTINIHWITAFPYELLFHEDFCASVSNCSSLSFQRL